MCGHKRELFNPLKPNDHYSGRTAPLTSECCILYIYSTNTGTKYFKHVIYSPFFSLQNSVCFIILMYLVPVLFTFHIQGVLKLKKNNSGAKRLRVTERVRKCKKNKKKTNGPFQGHIGWVIASGTKRYLTEGQRQDARCRLRSHPDIYP